MPPVKGLWLGYSRPGGRATLGLEATGNRVLILGERAAEAALLATYAAREAGIKPVVLDLGGLLANSLSGYIDTFDYRSFLYDSFRLEEPGAWHAQMVAAAYAAVLDLTSEEEAIVNSALQQIASQGDLASPVSVYDVLGKVEGFRGFYVDRLKGRVGGLKLFDAVDDRAVRRLFELGGILDFSRAPYPQAAELAAALVVAKLLALSHSDGHRETAVVLTEAHRLFKSSPRQLHSCRLLAQVLAWPPSTFMATEQSQTLAPQLLQGCQVRVYSSDAWHQRPGATKAILRGTFVLEDTRSRSDLVFVPRRVPVKTSEHLAGRPAKYASPYLTSKILEEVARFSLSTRESVIQFLSPDFLPADIGAEIDSLHARGCLLQEPKDSGSGPRVFAYTVTEKGLSLLVELRK
ncbi:MAG: hypothetical protein HY297_01440 [Thaumarchaeota archaeon]|nr:hypothetical protein [Nitrososphaerota archaeon]